MRLIVAGLVVGVALGGAGCAPVTSAPPSATAEDTPAQVKTKAKDSALSASRLVAQLARRGHDLPNPRVNTGFCQEAGCTQLVTTDSVSVSQFRKAAEAKRYAAAMSNAGPAEHVGPFVLSW